MRREIALTDDELEARFAALGYGVCEEDLVYTRETIDFGTVRAVFAG